MDIDHALEIIARARRQAEELSVSMAFAVVDAAGHLVAFARMNGSSFLATEIAIGKAYTAAGTKMPTSALAKMAADEVLFATGAAAATRGRFLIVPGGAPVFQGGELVGAIGASGSSVEHDAQVAEGAALEQG